MAHAFRDAAANKPLVVDLAGRPAGSRPGFVIAASDWRDGFEATTSNQVSQSASEVARQAYIERISNQWKQTAQALPRSATKPRPGLAMYDPTGDNAATGVQSSDVPSDVAQMSMSAQQAYCRAYNTHMQENPDADDEECDAAGREAISGMDSAPSIADAEARRDAAWRARVARQASAWRNS
jgi:hypothetical protein